MNKHTKRFERKMTEAVSVLNELKQEFLQLDESDLKIIQDAHQDVLGAIEDFRNLRQTVLTNIKKNDVVATMTVVSDDNTTTITLGDKEYVLSIPCNHRRIAQDEYHFPADNPLFVMFINRREGTISVGTKDAKAGEILNELKGFHKDLNVSNTGKIVNAISHYADIDLHDKLLTTLVDAMNVVTV